MAKLTKKGCDVLKNTKKIICLIISLSMILSMLSGCTSRVSDNFDKRKLINVKNDKILSNIIEDGKHFQSEFKKIADSTEYTDEEKTKEFLKLYNDNSYIYWVITIQAYYDINSTIENKISDYMSVDSISKLRDDKQALFDTVKGLDEFSKSKEKTVDLSSGNIDLMDDKFLDIYNRGISFYYTDYENVQSYYEDLCLENNLIYDNIDNSISLYIKDEDGNFVSNDEEIRENSKNDYEKGYYIRKALYGEEYYTWCANATTYKNNYLNSIETYGGDGFINSESVNSDFSKKTSVNMIANINDLNFLKHMEFYALAETASRSKKYEKEISKAKTDKEKEKIKKKYMLTIKTKTNPDIPENEKQSKDVTVKASKDEWLNNILLQAENFMKDESISDPTYVVEEYDEVLDKNIINKDNLKSPSYLKFKAEVKAYASINSTVFNSKVKSIDYMNNRGGLRYLISDIQELQKSGLRTINLKLANMDKLGYKNINGTIKISGKNNSYNGEVYERSLISADVENILSVYNSGKNDSEDNSFVINNKDNYGNIYYFSGNDENINISTNSKEKTTNFVYSYDLNNYKEDKDNELKNLYATGIYIEYMSDIYNIWANNQNYGNEKMEIPTYIREWAENINNYYYNNIDSSKTTITARFDNFISNEDVNIEVLYEGITQLEYWIMFSSIDGINLPKPVENGLF